MATLDRAIGSDADFVQGDEEEFFDLGDFGDCWLGDDWMVAARFPNITVPAGATIDVAYVVFDVADENSSGTVQTNVTAVDEDDHAAPTSWATWNTDHGLHTTASATWDFSTVSSGTVQTSSLVSVIQEIIDRGGWASGNDIGIHVDLDGSTDPQIALDGATLHIEYTEAGGGDPATIMPVVIDSDAVEDTSAGTTGQGGPVVSYSAGDRVILFVASDGADENITPSALAGGGTFAAIVDSDSDAQSDAHTMAGFYADATGPATDDTLNYAIGSSEESSAIAYVLDAGTFDPDTPPEAAVVGITTNNNDPDPPALTPSWPADTDVTLWGVAIAWDADTSATTFTWTGGGSAFPDGRLELEAASDGSAGLVAGYTETDPEVATLNPAVFTNAMSTSEEWTAITWAVRGAEGGTEPVEITASPVSFGLSAIAPSVEPAELTITGTPVSFGLAPQAGTVTPAELTITASPVVFDLEPQVATVVAPVAITASPVEFGLDPQAASVAVPVIITASPVSFGLSVIAPSVDLATTTVTASPVSFSLEPQSASLSAGIFITASPVEFGLEPQAPEVDVEPITITASPVSFGLTAIAPTITPAELTITASPVEFNLTPMPGETGTPVAISASPAVFGLKALPGVKLINRDETPAFYRRVHRGNRPRRMGWRRPPSHR